MCHIPFVLRDYKNLCCICSGNKTESNTRKIRTRTHSHAPTKNWREHIQINIHLLVSSTTSLQVEKSVHRSFVVVGGLVVLGFFLLGDVAFLGVAADAVERLSAGGVLWVTREGGGGFFNLVVEVLSLYAGAFGGPSPFFSPSPSDLRTLVTGFSFWGSIGGVSDLSFLRPMHRASCFLRADFCEMTNLLTIPAA